MSVMGCEKQLARQCGDPSASLFAGCHCPADPNFPSHVSASSSPAGTEGWAARLPVSGDLQLLAALQVRCPGLGGLVACPQGFWPSQSMGLVPRPLVAARMSEGAGSQG